ncbi:hypothetical protein CHLNCDRAFT_57859 [Chlorella variabilis]|uniref:Uncharacterized protein n=1 Tax=Chlorella variabilis TaxID=554065 RepID=E1ZEM6_CHLVA|nr:hypothetical protein CHLNCDRAFT_57859 [Chlorella variabilis]EFN55687.1 hypothetical protein CHLNCDRAFT_57859 [Chlorella variabilis]|eukprot:XP_005847789.1 hypothetical protein CHLNCDRAFT_57859 [Chlorella variabilis]
MDGEGKQRERKRHGRRLRALEDAFHRTVKYALRPVDYEQFQEQFPAFKDPLVQDLYSGYKQALHHTRVNIEADFGELCEEHELRDKLNTLEVMCEEQGIGDGDAAEGARQPALGPTNAIRLSLLRAKQQELESLRGVLAEVEAHNARLQGQMAERRRQAQELIAKTQPIAAQLDVMHLSSKAWANRVVEPV